MVDHGQLWLIMVNYVNSINGGIPNSWFMEIYLQMDDDWGYPYDSGNLHIWRWKCGFNGEIIKMENMFFFYGKILGKSWED